MDKPTKETKFKTVIDKNTFYFYNRNFEEKYEGYLNSLKQTLLILKNKIETRGLKKEFFENLLIEKENGLRSLLALTGLSNETFLAKTIHLFEFKKLSISKLKFEIPS